MRRYQTYHCTTRRRPEPKLIQIMSVPESMKVFAIYDEDGTEIEQPIHVMGLFSDGDTRFLEPDNCGVFEPPECMTNFKRYRISSVDGID